MPLADASKPDFTLSDTQLAAYNPSAWFTSTEMVDTVAPLDDWPTEDDLGGSDERDRHQPPAGVGTLAIRSDLACGWSWSVTVPPTESFAPTHRVSEVTMYEYRARVLRVIDETPWSRDRSRVPRVSRSGAASDRKHLRYIRSLGPGNPHFKCAPSEIESRLILALIAGDTKGLPKFDVARDNEHSTIT